MYKETQRGFLHKEKKKFENCKVSGSAGIPLVHTVRFDLKDILTFIFKGYDFTILQSSSFGLTSQG